MNIMIIDDDVVLMDMISHLLNKYNHSVTPYTEPISAIEDLKINKYDILIINYIMVPVNGDRIVELVRQFNKEIYIIMMSYSSDLIPSLDILQKLDIQAFYQKNSRFDQLMITIQSGIKYIKQLDSIKEMHNTIETSIIDFANILLNTISAKDNYTGEHSKRVAGYAVKFADYLNLSEKDKEILRLAGMFHDIGKIGTPDYILNKKGKLTDKEYDIIKFHPTISSNILSSSPMFKDVYPIVEVHHERIDGKGYPNKLKGKDIPYLGKILAICDTYDAMTTTRPYQDASILSEAIIKLKKAAGPHLDKDLTYKFIKMLEKN